MKLYISGPIASDPRGIEFVRQRFQNAWHDLIDVGYEAINPFDIPAECGDTCEGQKFPDASGHTWACYLKYDLITMLGCDGLAMLPGWEHSPGANFERDVATKVGLPCYPISDWLRDAA